MADGECDLKGLHVQELRALVGDEDPASPSVEPAAAAIGVTITTIRRCGGYSKDSRVPEQKYIDPTCPPTPAGIQFFGWLRPPSTT